MTPTPSQRSVRTEQVGSEVVAMVTCPRCGGQGPGDERFCESCGLDQTVRDLSWAVEIVAHRARFEQAGTRDFVFPASRQSSVRRFESDQATIGRRSVARNIHPDLDLSDEISDPGVSHVHAMMTRNGEGRLVITDLGSTNGTTINDGPDPITPHEPHALTDGDRIHLGLWTTLTLRCPRDQPW